MKEQQQSLLERVSATAAVGNNSSRNNGSAGSGLYGSLRNSWQSAGTDVFSPTSNDFEGSAAVLANHGGIGGVGGDRLNRVEVSAKEVTIVVFVLILWVAAIALFYHQWGKINGFGSYQLDYVHANLEISAKISAAAATGAAPCRNGITLEPAAIKVSTAC